MRQVLIIAVLGMSALLAGCSTPTAETEQKEFSSHAVTYEVYGMDCPGCHGGLEKNLKKIPGVLEATANWKQKRVTLSLDEAADVPEDQIVRAVEDSNFTLGKQLL
jgi:copper chaperone CopZ